MGSVETVRQVRRLDRWRREWSHFWDDFEAVKALGPMDDSISPDQFRLFARMLTRHPPVELDRLLRALWIDAAGLALRDPARFHEMEEVCASCREWRRCREAARNGSLPDSYGIFSPNTLTLQPLMPARPVEGDGGEQG